MASHDHDVRYRDRETRSRVAGLYLPLLGIVMDCLDQLHDPRLEAGQLAGAAQREELQVRVSGSPACVWKPGNLQRRYDSTRCIKYRLSNAVIKQNVTIV